MIGNTHSLLNPEPAEAAEPQGLSALLGVSRLLVSQSNLDQLLNLIMTEATRLMRAERSSLFLLDEANRQLTSFIAQKAEVKEIRLPLGCGIAGTVAESGKTIRLDDAYDSPLFDRSWDLKTGFRTRSVLCVPMRNEKLHIIGVIQVLNRSGGVFEPSDESALLLFASHAAIAIQNLRLNEDLKLVFLSGIRALAQAVDSRDPATAGHSERVTCYAVRIAEALSLSHEEITALEYAATLHDVGKIAVPDHILTKPGRLTDEEYGLIKKHASDTRAILAKFHFTGNNAQVPFIAGAHHERLDGTGYPDGLKGEQLPLAARILAVADVFDALTSFDRSYRSAMTPGEAIALLQEEAGTKLDARVVQVFVERELFLIERRRFVRIDMDVSIEYRILPRDRSAGLARQAPGRTLDLAGHGLRFIANEFVPVGSYLETAVHLGRESIEMLAKVTRIDRVGQGHQFEVSIAFANLARAVEVRLQKYLIALAGS